MVNPDRRNGTDRPEHLWGRGISHRTIVEDVEDMRYFLSRLARVVRLGLLEVLAFSILSNHYHLLVRSPSGELSRAMQIILADFVRWFNRRRGRDGRLFRGPFGSKVVWSDAYLYTLARYLDFNPVKAGIVAHPGEYVHGSARFYLEGNGPVWLERGYLEEKLRRVRMAPEYRPDLYRALLAVPPTRGEVAVVERRMRSRADFRDPLDALLGATSAGMKEWFREKNLLADGQSGIAPLVSAAMVLEVIEEMRRERGELSCRPRGRSIDGWAVMACGLLRQVCALTLRETAARVATSPGSVERGLQQHDILLASDEYAELAAEILSLAVRRDFPWIGPGGGTEANGLKLIESIQMA